MDASIITLKQRKQYRQALKEFKSFIEPVEKHLLRGTQLDSRLPQLLQRMTGASELPNQLKALQSAYDTLDKQYEDELLFAAPLKLSHFCEYVHRDEPPAAHHEFLIDHMEMIHAGEISRLAISAPPGSAKSTYASIRYPAWHLGRRPNDRWVQGAHTQTFAKDRLGKPVRGLITEKRYQAVFPEMMLSASSAAADYFEFAGARGYYKAVGVGTSISGYRFEIGGIDDPIGSRQDAMSPAKIKELHSWFEDDFGTRGSNPHVPMYIVATRWVENDLIGHELQKMAEGRGSKWTVINIPAIAEENDPLGREVGEGLWPEVFGTEFYMRQKRALPARSWNSLYMGKPTDADGGVLKLTDIHRYDTLPQDIEKNGVLITKNIKHITLSVDCAEKDTQRSDFTAATVWIETMDKKHYLAHAARIKAEFGDITKFIDHIAETWNVNSILVEDRGAGTQYIQIRKIDHGPAPVIAINTKQQSKMFRFDGVTPMFSAGEVFLPESGNDWIADLESELLGFPNAKNDDYVDSVSQYLSYRRDRNGGRRGVSKIGSTRHAR